MNITNKNCESKQKINLDNYLTKKKINKYSTEENDIKTCLKKYILIYSKQINIKIFVFFSLHCIRMEQKTLIFGKQCINKNACHKNKRPISIDTVEIKRIALSKRDLYGKKRFI